MRLAITGTAGQAVRSLQAIAAQQGVEVLAIGRPELDLEQPLSVLPALANAKPDIIVSAAAYTAVDQAELEPDKAYAVNAGGAGAVARAATDLGVPIIHLSTDYVFDGKKLGGYGEHDAPAPLSVYGASKLAGEQEIKATTPDHVILRIGWLYSPFGKNFLKAMIEQAERVDRIRVVADQRGGPTSALDLALVILDLARRLQRDPEPELRGLFHLGPPQDASWAEFATAIFQAYGTRTGKRVAVDHVKAVEYARAAMRPANSWLDSKKIEQVYGVRMRPWTASVGEVVNHLLQTQHKEALA